MRLDKEDMIRADSERVRIFECMSDALTNVAELIATDVDKGEPKIAFKSYEVLNPGDVTPETESRMVRFLLVRLRLAAMCEMHEDADRTLLALSRWGAETADVFDALEGVGRLWESRPLSGNIFWPAGTRNVPVMPVKSRTGRRRS